MKEPEAPYEPTKDFYIILVFRLVFVVIFEHVVFLVLVIFKFLIPDEPKEVTIQKQLARLDAKEKRLEDGKELLCGGNFESSEKGESKKEN
jgi:hypothetical protein